MSSFRELQEIYEGYRGLAQDFGPNSKYTARLDIKNSYMGGPGTSPSGENRPTVNRIGTYSEDGEDGVPDKTVSKNAVKQKINEIIADAESRGMNYAKEQFFDLLSFVEKL